MGQWESAFYTSHHWWNDVLGLWTKMESCTHVAEITMAKRTDSSEVEGEERVNDVSEKFVMLKRRMWSDSCPMP